MSSSWHRLYASLCGVNVTDTICVLAARPRRCSTLSNPVPWQNWMAAYLGYTLRMKTLFRGWPVMVHDTHMRRRRLGSTLAGSTQSSLAADLSCLCEIFFFFTFLDHPVHEVQYAACWLCSHWDVGQHSEHMFWWWTHVGGRRHLRR